MHYKTFSFHTHDFEELQDIISSWDQSYTKIGTGKFHGSQWYAEVGPLILFRERWGQQIHYRGTPPPGMTAMAIPLRQVEHGNWLGKFAGHDSILFQVDGKEAELMSVSSWDSIVILIPHSMLIDHLQDLGQTSFDEVQLSSKVILPKRDLISVLRRKSFELLELTHNTAFEKTDSFFREDMVDSVLEFSALTLMSDKELRSINTNYRNYKQLIRKAEEYCDSVISKPLRIRDMCKELHINERTLRHAFRKYLNISPLAHLKARKMNRIHRILKKSSPGEFMIKQVAYSNGFFHLGQFCHDYRNLFGELPTHTLNTR